MYYICIKLGITKGEHMPKGITIKELRSKLRLTQSEFGKEIGVHWMAVSFWELGKRTPTVSNIRKIEEKYKVKLNY